MTGRLYTESYDILILATGAKPASPSVEGADAPGVFLFRTCADACMIEDWIQEHHPKTVGIVGAGAAGIALAENLHARDLHVTLLEQEEQIFAPFDLEMAAQLQQHLEDNGVSVFTHSRLEKIHCTLQTLEIHFNRQVLPMDMIILTMGVVPESDLAAQAGLTLGAQAVSYTHLPVTRAGVVRCRGWPRVTKSKMCALPIIMRICR